MADMNNCKVHFCNKTKLYFKLSDPHLHLNFHSLGDLTEILTEIQLVAMSSRKCLCGRYYVR